MAALALREDITDRHEWPLPPALPYMGVDLAPLVAVDDVPSPEAWPEGITARFKIKLDPAGLEQQRRILRDHQRRWSDHGRVFRLRLDANRHLEPGLRAELETWCRELPIEWLEDPCDTLAASRALCDELGVALAVDEFLPAVPDDTGCATWLETWRPAAVILKPSLLGRCETLERWCRLGRERAVQTVFSSCFESPWALRVFGRWASALAPDTAHGLGTAHFFQSTSPAEPGAPLARMESLARPERPPFVWHLCPGWTAAPCDPHHFAGLPGCEKAVSLMAPAGVRDPDLPAAGSRVACRWPAPGGDPSAAGRLLALLDRRCSVFPQDPRLTPVLAVARARQAGCDALLDLANGTWTVLDTVSPRPELPGSGPHLLVATGGSSGRSRIVCHSLRSLLAGASGALAAQAFGPGDSWLLALPLHHVGGLSVLFRAVLGGGALAIPRVGESLVQALCRLAPSHVSLVPTQLAGLLEDPAAVAVLRACRLVLMGGAALPEGLRRRSLELGIPVAASWGLTETGGQVCTALPGTPGSGPDDVRSCGRPLPGREVRVHEGELQVRGPVVCEGWITEQGFEPAVGADGWFSSGDLGTIDAAGTVHVSGRRERMLISGGENLYPEEIEQLLEGHPGIRRACVLAVDHGTWGQRPVAVLDFSGMENRLPGEWETWLEHNLPRLMRPDMYYAWPAGLQGLKTPWAELAARLSAGSLEPLAAP
jgi:O-succinylbenzoic acid--CoA ligase